MKTEHPTRNVTATMLSQGAVTRLILALGIAALLWAGVFWALSA